jgi:hypothetical protein
VPCDIRLLFFYHIILQLNSFPVLYKNWEEITRAVNKCLLFLEDKMFKHIIQFKNNTYSVLFDKEKLNRWILNRIFYERKILCIRIIDMGDDVNENKL